MGWTIESALDDDLISNPRKLLSGYQFTLGEIPVLITIRLYKQLNGKNVEFEQSHFIHTPIQGGPYMTSIPWNDDEASALHQVISGFTRDYNAAVKQGHKPAESWLVPNKNFR
ncbi:MAG: hypothetical protein V1701_02320 [Planctomycetota bacterium]